MRFRRRDEQADFVGAEARVQVGERALDRAHVGAGRLVVNAGPARERLEQLGGIGELRHDFGIGVGGGLDALEAEAGEALDQRALGGGGHEGRLVLQAVAREALAEGHCGHS